MEHLKLKELQQSAILEADEIISACAKSSMGTMVGHINSLHIAAYMDIEKTTKGLNKILAYKKELAVAMLRNDDEERFKIISEAIKYADDMILKVLGISVQR